tara:strand:+ start:297 stop:995 length:699 start_codon:yes stop_codon:yes gene_type:complete
MPVVLSIEGNIGSGKSTILKFLKENNTNNDIIFLKEPVDKWENIKDVEGTTILEHFYKDPSKHAFMFQIMAFATRMQILKDTIKENPHCKIVICERSILADQQVFASMLHYDNLIDKMGITIYNTMANNYLKEYPLNGIIYIDAEPDICSTRIKTRNRNGEDNIGVEYLKKCKLYHDEWLLTYPKYNAVPETTTNNTTLLHIKTNQSANFNSENDISKIWLREIQQYINSFL